MFLIRGIHINPFFMYKQIYIMYILIFSFFSRHVLGLRSVALCSHNRIHIPLERNQTFTYGCIEEIALGIYESISNCAFVTNLAQCKVCPV